jgi:hypothetical protein
MQACVGHLRGQGDHATALTSLEASLESHEMAFAAERSRHTAEVVAAQGPVP